MDGCGDQHSKTNITETTTCAPSIMSAKICTRTPADKHREVRTCRAELRALSKGETAVGYLKTGVNKDAEMLRQAMYAPHNGIVTGDVSGKPLSGEMVKAARRLELEFFEKMGAYTRGPRAQALASRKSKRVQC